MNNTSCLSSTVLKNVYFQLIFVAQVNKLRKSSTYSKKLQLICSPFLVFYFFFINFRYIWSDNIQSKYKKIAFLISLFLSEILQFLSFFTLWKYSEEKNLFFFFDLLVLFVACFYY